MGAIRGEGVEVRESAVDRAVVELLEACDHEPSGYRGSWRPLGSEALRAAVATVDEVLCALIAALIDCLSRAASRIGDVPRALAQLDSALGRAS